MKKIFDIFMTFLLFVTLSGCSTSTETTPTLIEATSMPAVVQFADPILEAMVREAMGKPEGDITVKEAEAVTRLNLNNEWQRFISNGNEIKDISGLENFKNLESLDLSFHSITNLLPLAELTKLTLLSLNGNPVTDISPLSKLINMKVLILSNCMAQDYTPLEALVNLEYLKLDNSTITDISSLASLTHLKHLYLASSPVNDYSPLRDIYQGLETKDFTIVSTLKELGFVMDYGNHETYFDSEEASFAIHHEAWGMPSREDNQNIIRMSMYLNGEYKASVGYYGVHKLYVCQIDKEGQPQVNYLYNLADGSSNISPEDRPNAEQMIRGAMDVLDGEDVLYAPIRLYNDAVMNTFHMTPEKLFALPYEPLSLKSLGFVPDENPDIYMYEQHEGIYTSIRIDHTDKAEKEYDVVFFQPISDEYRVNMYYFVAEKKLYVKADDNDMGGASFWISMDTGEHIDEWCSENTKTVKDYFIQAYNDPGIKDVYLHSLDLMAKYFGDAFGMTIDELFALPTGEFDQ